MITDLVNQDKLLFVAEDFWKFISEQNIVGSAIGIIIANYVRDLSTAVSTGIIIPIIKRTRGTSNGDNDIIVSVFGINFRFDKIINILTNMIITLSVFYFVIKMLPQYMNKVKSILN